MTKELKILQKLWDKKQINDQEYYLAITQIAGDDLMIDYDKDTDTTLYRVNKNTVVLCKCGSEMYIVAGNSLPQTIEQCNSYNLINWHELSDNNQNEAECKEFAHCFPAPIASCDKRWEEKLNNLLSDYSSIHILDMFRPGIVKEDALEWAAFIANTYIGRNKLERKGRYDKYFVFDNMPDYLRNTPFINWRWIKNVYTYLVNFANKLAKQDDDIIKQNSVFTCSLRDIEKYAWNMQQKLYKKEWELDNSYRKGAIFALELILKELEKHDTIADDTYDY